MLVNTVSNISIKSLTNPLPTGQNLSESHTGIYVATLQLKRYLLEILAQLELDFCKLNMYKSAVSSATNLLK